MYSVTAESRGGGEYVVSLRAHGLTGEDGEVVEHGQHRELV